MSVWYEYHLIFLVGWILNGLILVAMEFAEWRQLVSTRNATAISHKLNLIGGYPTMIGTIICFVFLHDSSNFQFPTYVIFVISCAIFIYTGMFAAFLIHRRKEHQASGDEQLVRGYINRLRLSLFISLLAALLAAAAEMHILTDWVTELWS